MFSPNRIHTHVHQCIYCGAPLKNGSEICGHCGSRLPRRDDLWQEDRDRKLSLVVWPIIAATTGSIGAYVAYVAVRLDETSNVFAFATLFPLLLCGLCILGAVLLNVVGRIVKH